MMAQTGDFILLFIVALYFLVLLLLMLVILFEVSKLVQKDKEAKTVGDQARVFGKLDGRVEILFEQIASGLSHNFERQVERQLAKYAQEAENSTRGIAKFVEDQQKVIARESQFLVASAFSRTQKELEQYKKDGLAKIDEDLNQIVLEAARDVLGRSISLSEHEELVRSALEKAKKKRFFS
ncbi:hypothetical protein A3B51_03505 [Candidatus Curtissbacteria bacterium RIFCSPLOWO2_01_FULL_41_18]|uniref:Uncharacterized protein n=2 Tax=Candidatus Curtissiibacteriota TaxID=1752717 RepID=A0A1F5G0V4_9BACT|nr:MAG: hypothetical protein A2696_01070 [Candidatus Curtissbacteria bacterium RIFCSPHIGHO2_01_FULL_41_13]OGE04133.1 MAG: hypothetical protein A3B51_03505 [Candidatus Curtissbacteria bacterium RIFCSPLOWO2_01_FULL_41_18]